MSFTEHMQADTAGFYHMPDLACQLSITWNITMSYVYAGYEMANTRFVRFNVYSIKAFSFLVLLISFSDPPSDRPIDFTL